MADNDNKNTPATYQLQNKLNLPWKTRMTLPFLNLLSDCSLRPNGTVNRLPFRLVGSLGLKVSADPKPFYGVSSKDITVDSSRDLWFRLFTPITTHEENSSLPVIVFFHGGGFVHLGPDFKSYDFVCRRFAKKVPAVVLSVNYRLAPEFKCPAQYEDGFEVLKFIDKDGGNLLPANADLSRCFLAGDSAGANLSHHVAKRVCESLSTFSYLKVTGVVSIQPFFGGEERTKSEIELEQIDVIVSIKRTDWMWKAFLPSGPEFDRDHECINVTGPRQVDISKLNFPATMVVIAGFDSLKDWQKRYYEWLKKSKVETYLVEYPNMIHAFYVFPELQESSQLISEVKQFIDNQFSKASSQLISDVKEFIDKQFSKALDLPKV